MATGDTTTYKTTILVTGGTAGLGYYCAKEIAQRRPDALVVVASRTSNNYASHQINTSLGQSNVKYLPLNLADLDNVRAFVQYVLSKNYPPFSALVCNAGMQYHGELQLTRTRIEKTFAVNHVGHALLFHLLRPHLAPDCRIVLTTSSTHDPALKVGVPDAVYTNAEELAYPSEKTKSNPGLQRYTTSKLCNVLWTYVLDRHIQSSTNPEVSKQWTVTTMDPGLMYGTSLARDAGLIFSFLFTWIYWLLGPIFRLTADHIRTPQASGVDLARLAIDQETKGISARYFSGKQELKSSADSYDKTKQEDLWTWTAKFVARDPQEEERFLNLS